MRRKGKLLIRAVFPEPYPLAAIRFDRAVRKVEHRFIEARYVTAAVARTYAYAVFQPEQHLRRSLHIVFREPVRHRRGHIRYT